MFFKLDFWSITFALGAFQGLFLSIVLFFRDSTNRQAMRILSIIVLLFSLMVAEEFIDAARLYRRWPHAALVTTPVDVLIGALMFFYVRFMIEPGRNIRWKDAFHIVPFIATVVAILPFYTLSAAEKLSYFRQGIPVPMAVLTYLKSATFAAYLLAAYWILQRSLRQPDGGKEPLSPGIHVIWCRRALIGLALYGALLLVLYSLSMLGFEPGIDSDYVGSLVMTSLSFVLSVVAIRYPRAYFGASVQKPGAPKYRTSPLSTAQKDHYLFLLQKLMQNQKPYLDPDLDLDKLATSLSMSPHHLSQVLNERLQKSFYEYVNELRVEEFKSRLTSDASATKNLLGIALECGFNSKASFNRAFKQVTGIPPSKYRKVPSSIRV